MDGSQAGCRRSFFTQRFAGCFSRHRFDLHSYSGCQRKTDCPPESLLESCTFSDTGRRFDSVLQNRTKCRRLDRLAGSFKRRWENLGQTRSLAGRISRSYQEQTGIHQSARQAERAKGDGAFILNIRMIKAKPGKRQSRYLPNCLSRLRTVKKVVLT